MDEVLGLLFKQAANNEQAENWKKAKQYLHTALILDPGNEQAQKGLQRLEAKEKAEENILALIASGDEALNAGALERAAGFYNAAFNTSTEYSLREYHYLASVKLRSVRDEYLLRQANDRLQHAEDYLKKQDYHAAYELLQKIFAELPEDEMFSRSKRRAVELISQTKDKLIEIDPDMFTDIYSWIHIADLDGQIIIGDRNTINIKKAISNIPILAQKHRVLNLNFADENSQRVLALNENLISGQMYTLLVDVGLLWDSISSMMLEMADFPEDAEMTYLSASDRAKGWFDLEAVFVSQDFEPNMVSARMRVPTQSLERSIPYLGQEPGPTPGPVRLKMQAPGSQNKRAHGRLCLYYGAQVLQSAIVNVGVSQTITFDENLQNFAIIDYVLGGSLDTVGRKMLTRQRSTKNGQPVETPVKVGLMLNDDLSGTHRLLLKVDDETDETASLPPAWKAYDSSAISEMLEEARRILSNPTGTGPNYESDTFIFDKFKEDLLALAKLGVGLYNMLLQGLTPADGINPILWRKKFRGALQPGDVIQLARAGSVPSTHIIPWALVYDGPLELDRSDLPLTLCRVVNEQWNADAKRKLPFTTQENFVCPYAHEHAENTVCPFDFWGYKYTLEQPISALLGKNWDVAPARRILAGTPVKMAVAATEDVPRENRRLQHFQSIHDSVNAEYLPAAPASERDQVRDSLLAPQLVYILCHGGKDGKITYLSIGPHGKDARYTITPELPGTWGERDYIDVEKWAKTRPLVFINGCYTTDLLPELTLNFVSAFRDLLAGGVIGTEIPVTVEAGYLAAEKFFERLGRGADVGQAILGMRWDLLNQGSLLGLAYTPYAMSDLHLER